MPFEYRGRTGVACQKCKQVVLMSGTNFRSEATKGVPNPLDHHRSHHHQTGSKIALEPAHVHHARNCLLCGGAATARIERRTQYQSCALAGFGDGTAGASHDATTSRNCTCPGNAIARGDHAAAQALALARNVRITIIGRPRSRTRRIPAAGRAVSRVLSIARRWDQ